MPSPPTPASETIQPVEKRPDCRCATYSSPHCVRNTDDILLKSRHANRRCARVWSWLGFLQQAASCVKQIKARLVRHRDRSWSPARLTHQAAMGAQPRAPAPGECGGWWEWQAVTGRRERQGTSIANVSDTTRTFASYSSRCFFARSTACETLRTSTLPRFACGYPSSCAQLCTATPQSGPTPAPRDRAQDLSGDGATVPAIAMRSSQTTPIAPARPEYLPTPG